jgi:hypothetical protein
MVFMGDWCTKRGENPITGGLYDVTVRTMHRVDPQLERRGR